MSKDANGEDNSNSLTEEMQRIGMKPNSGREKIFEVLELGYC